MVDSFTLDGSVAVEERPSPDYSIETITPELAREYLKYNESNRGIKKRYVQILAGAMLRGEWQVNGVPIIFDENGNLIDGQHRLSAVVMSGATIQSAVLRGLTPEVQHSLDIGVRRTLGDQLTVRGEKNATNLASAINWLWKFERYDKTGMRSVINNERPTITQGLKILELNPALREAVQASGRVYRANKGTPVGVIAACHYQFASRDPQDAEVFFEYVVSGAGLDEGLPIYALRATLRRYNDRRPKPSQVYYAAVLRKAWNAYRRGDDDIRMLGYSPGGSRNERFPMLEDF